MTVGHSLTGVSHDSFGTRKEVRAEVTDGYTHLLPALRTDAPRMTVQAAAQYLIDSLMPENITPLDEAMLLSRETPERKAANAEYSRKWRDRMAQTEEGREHLRELNRESSRRRRTDGRAEKNRACQREWARKHRASPGADTSRTNQD